MAAGLVDSLCLSVAWTVVVLQVNQRHGLAAAGLCSAAMLVGVAVSAPVAGRLARRLEGRRLLRTAAGVEAVLRLSVFVLLFADAPVWALALCVAAMNVTAWTGYAGMRAEVAAASTGAGALTWYGTIVAAVEAVGVAVAALLPGTTGTGPGPVLLGVMAAYVLALVPTVVVAGASPVPRAGPRPRLGRLRPGVSAPTASGALLMCVASAPTLLAVALAAQMHGRAAVGLAAVAFTLGSLAAPTVASRIERWGANHVGSWVLCALGMVAGWVLAPLHVVLLLVAQAMSGLFMTSLEGLLDATAARQHPGQVTGALARATAARALGSAAGTAALPLLVARAGFSPMVGAAAAALVALGLLTHVARMASRRGAPTGPAVPLAPAGAVDEIAPATASAGPAGPVASAGSPSRM